MRGNCETYQERYLNVFHNAVENESNYNQLGSIIDEVESSTSLAICRTDNDFESVVAPNLQHENQQDLHTGTTESTSHAALHPGLNSTFAQYDLAQDLHLSVPKNNPDLQELQRKTDIPDSDFRAMCQKLNKKQRIFFYHCLHWFKTRTEPLYVFLTGGAGVGKSLVLRTLHHALTRTLGKEPGDNPDSLRVLLTAPTGKAAFNINGTTLHTAFQIPINQGFQYKNLTADRLNTLRARLRDLVVVFIDEISMVGNGLFNFVNLRLQEIMGVSEPFGGVSIVAFGDFFQLKPVRDGWIFHNSKLNYSSLASNVWKDLFMMYELTDIMRQKDDVSFAQLLNRVREGNQTPKDIEILQTRQVKVPSCEPITHLYQTNDEVNNHNLKLFQTLDVKVFIHSVDTVIGHSTSQVKEKLLQSIPLEPQKTMGLQGVLPIAVGQQCEISVNVLVEDGLTNGSPGTIRLIDTLDNPVIIWVEFDDPSVGKLTRHNLKFLCHGDIPSNWTPVTKITRQFQVGKSKNAEILRRQFPLRPASAKTVHKAQGDTMCQVVVDFSKRMLTDHIYYVALSRVISMNRLFIKGFFPQNIKVSNVVKLEMARMRQNRNLLPLIQDLSRVESSCLILHHNARSLAKYIHDIESDSKIHCASILVFTESRIHTATTQYQLPGYTLFVNPGYQSSTGATTCHGTSLFCRNDILPTSITTTNSDDTEVTILQFPCETFKSVTVVTIYRSPNGSLSHFLHKMDDLLKELLEN